MNVSKDFKKKLLNGASASAIAVAAVFVPNINVANAGTLNLTNNTPNNAATGTTNNIVTSSDAGIAFLDASGAITLQTAAITNDTLVRIGLASGTDNAVAITASTISAGKTLTVELGIKTKAGVSDANSAVHQVSLAGLTGATANVGSVIVKASDTVGTVPNQANTATIGTGSATSLDTLTIRGGNGGALGGGALTITELGTALLGVSVNTLTLSGGNGSAAAGAKVGGALIITEVDAAVSGTTYTITGGAGGLGTASGGVGGATILSAHAGAVSSTTFNVNAGDGGAGAARTGGAGGAMTITGMAGAITSSTINIGGGDGGNGADNVAVAVGGAGGVNTTTFTSLIGVVATPVTLNISGGAGGTGGSAGASANNGSVGGAGGEVAGFTSGGAVFAATTITGGLGGSGGVGNATAAGGVGGVGGAVDIIDTTATMTGALVIDGGDGGSAGTTGTAFAGGAGAVGGSVTLTDFGAQVGAVTVTAGDGGSGAASSTTVTGGLGAAGGLVVVTDGMDSFAGTDANVGANMTIIAGNAGNAGNAGTTGEGGAAGAGGNNTFIVEGTADFAALVITGGNGGDGGDGGTGADGDSGANAAAGISDFTQTGNAEANTIAVTGGNAGNAGNDGGVTGSTAVAGSAGGAAIALFSGTLDGVGASATLAATVTVTGGTGGNGGNGGIGQAGVNGTAGGAATLKLTDTTIANITLDDGAAGTAGTTNTLAGGTAGAGGAAMVSFDGAFTFTGDISAAANNEGTVRVDAATDFVGNIGAEGASIKLLDISAGVLNSVSGNIHATDTQFTNGLGIITFDGTGTTTQTVSGKISLNGGTGQVIGGATAPVVFKSTVDVTTFTTNATGTVQFEDAVSTVTDFDAKDLTTIVLGEGIVAGETVITANQTGTIIAGSGAGTALAVTLPQAFTSGTITLVDYAGVGAASTGAADALKLNLSDSVLATYTAGVGSDATRLDITAVKKSSSSIATALGVSSTEAVHLDNANTALVTGDAAAATALTAALVAGGTTAKLAAETIGLQADTLGASASASMNTGGVVSGIASNRLASLRSNVGEQYASAGQDTGFNAGSGDMSKNFWMKGFGTWAEQDASGGIDGYDADTTGFSAGFDMETAPNYRLGASIGISNTDVDGDGSGKSTDAIASKQFTLYGDYTASNYFLEGSLGYAMNSSDKQRTITIGNLVRIASADDVDSDQFMWNVSGGMPMSLGGSTIFTPRAGMAYTLLKTENYTETGAVNLNQSVVTDDVSAFILSIGGKLHTKIPTENGNFVPSLHAGASYDVSGEEVVSNSTFTGGGAATTNTGAEQEQFAGNFGGGLAYEVDEASVGFTYDLSMKDGYSAHSGMLEAQFKF